MVMGSLFRHRSPPPNSLVRSELVAIDRLADAFGQLSMVNSSENACNQTGLAHLCFFGLFEDALRRFGVQKADRSYRASFPLNYRLIYPVISNHYPFSIFEGFMFRYTGIVVNGIQYAFGQESLRRADIAIGVWSELCAFLRKWRDGFVAWRRKTFTKSVVHDVLRNFDAAWAEFEYHHVDDLSDIESLAKEPFLRAMRGQMRLDEIEVNHEFDGNAPAYQEALCRFVQRLSELNVLANRSGKGRCLRVNILHAAQNVLAVRQVDLVSNESGGDGDLAAKVVAKQVMGSFDAIRCYLRSIKADGLALIDAQLRKNPVLVQRLMDWEESWETGQLYLLDSQMLVALCNVVTELAVIKKMSTVFAEMIENYDVELFLALPRLLWLCFLSDASKHFALMNFLQPELFVRNGAKHCPEQEEIGDEHFAELQGIMRQFTEVRQSLESESGSPEGFQRSAAWPIFVSKAVSGFDAGHGDDGPCAAQLAAFMLSLERRSVEMQRHCPQDWNKCATIILQCLTENDDVDRNMVEYEQPSISGQKTATCTVP
eukprot:TRINITY_DN62525_c0_g1_i1.p1 TRINITY_DN62525_c0_g1~~TRINITY_DN62525_c0_g1_i1.p1  ORF type:complete len:543 (-),score=82.22 TRINITY_DN62525_c0_g1_i1:284-1912(-)